MEDLLCLKTERCGEVKAKRFQIQMLNVARIPNKAIPLDGKIYQTTPYQLSNAEVCKNHNTRVRILLRILIFASRL